MTLTVETWVKATELVNGRAGYLATTESVQGAHACWYAEGLAPELGTPVIVTIAVGGYVKVEDDAA